MQDTSAQSGNVTLSRDKSASIKGLLICLVVLGHNIFFTYVFPAPCWRWLYCFHVACFFVLPFFYPEHQFSWSRVRNNAKRLLWPYTYMFFLLFLVNYFIFHKANVDEGLFNTFITGNFYQLKDYIGFQYLWFLPAMFSMLFIKEIYTSAAPYIKCVLMIFGAFFFSMFWVFLYSQPYSDSINPILTKISILSFMNGFAMFFLGLLTRYIIEKWSISNLLLILVMAVSLAAYIFFAKNDVVRPLIQWQSRLILPIIVSCLLINNISVPLKLGRVKY